MAQVNISERALAGIKLVAGEMGWDRRDAIGRFYDLWHDTQDLEKTHCTPRQLASWMGDDRVELLVTAMIEARFIRQDGDRLEIVGNKKHIEAIKKKRESGREGGLAAAANRRDAEQRAIPEAIANAQADATAHATETAYPVRYGTVQFGSVQHGTEQEGNGNKRARKPRTPKPPEIHPLLPQLVTNGEAETLLERVSQEVQEGWVKLYGADVVKREALKAAMWMKANPNKPRSNIAKFLGNWLSKLDGRAPPGQSRFPTKQEQITQSNLALLEELRSET